MKLSPLTLLCALLATTVLSRSQRPGTSFRSVTPVQAVTPARPFVAAFSPHNSAFASGISAVNTSDFQQAFDAFRRALADAPHDVRLLQLTGYSALRLGSPHEAEKYFNLALAEKPRNPWPLYIGLINAYAAEDRWSDFDLLRKRVREATQAGDPLLPRTGGYVIETFASGPTSITAVEYPSPAGPTQVRFRFTLAPDPAHPASPVEQEVYALHELSTGHDPLVEHDPSVEHDVAVHQSPDTAPCRFDLERTPSLTPTTKVTRRTSPLPARSFALLAYPQPACSQPEYLQLSPSLQASFVEEPTYEQLREQIREKVLSLALPPSPN